MRLVMYELNGKWRAGVAIEEKVVDSETAAKAIGMSADSDWTSNRSIIQLIPEEQLQLEERARTLAASHPSSSTVFLAKDIRLGPPVPDPDKIICLGLNYRSHAEEAGFSIPKVPILFAKYRNALNGPTSPIVLPSMSEEVDYEAELAVVIGKPCKDIAAAQALDYVAGYMAFNDVSARDLQFRSGQWLSGKTLDTFAPCGPALVMNEIRDAQRLNIATRVNGQVLQQSNTCNMIFSLAETISYISQLMTLEPGDIIATGTPEGVGFKRNPPIFLHHGDVVEVEVEGIGILRNPVIRNGRPRKEAA
ncbi:MAG TPA: fumarylacetoacetate hydrolase family protein [Anaerolineales bacterium]|nr:fumarylacetoacetate hydrolase family protein [Anaerolineales bacterium]